MSEKLLTAALDKALTRITEETGLVGGVVFTAATWLFTAMTDRLQSGPRAKLAPIIGALCIYLASQCFAGIIL